MAASGAMRWLMAGMMLPALSITAHAQPVGGCPPVALQGNDWSATVAAREVACDMRPRTRGMVAAPREPIPVAIYDPRVQFAFDSDALVADALPTLDRLAGYLLSADGATRVAVIEGHTDAAGSEHYNQALSERRAAVVRLYLSVRGVSGERLAAIGYGKTQPLAGRDPYDGMNRRVQFRLEPGGR